MEPWLIEKTKADRAKKDTRPVLRLPLEVWEDVLGWDEPIKQEEPKRGVLIIREPEDETEEGS